jgi:Sugar (and other) transporter
MLLTPVSLSWVYPTEVFPLATRSKGTALSTLAFSIAGGAINEVIPYLIGAIGFWVFIMFALINLAMLIPIFLFYVGEFCDSAIPFPNPLEFRLTRVANAAETANRHLEDLDLLLSGSSSLAWRAEKEFRELKARQNAEHSDQEVSAGELEEAKP